MTFEKLAWLWEKSGIALDGSGVGVVKSRLGFVANGLRNPEVVQIARSPDANGDLYRLLNERPEIYGAFVWPYQNADWNPEIRWQRIANHARVVDELGIPFRFGVRERMVLLDLDDIFDGAKIVLDQPRWFMREGGLVLNIFLDDFRAFCLAFSFHREGDGTLTAYIGAMQGRNRENILDTYRALTKQLHGVRPRDFLVEVFRMLCRSISVDRILAVSDAYRHHRHPFFKKEDADFTLNYDDIWEERSGVKIDDQTYELGIDDGRRPIEEIKSKKRSLYRKRYAMLDELEEKLATNLPNVKPVWFEDS